VLDDILRPCRRPLGLGIPLRREKHSTGPLEILAGGGGECAAERANRFRI
jgi:hypothetical protein